VARYSTQYARVENNNKKQNYEKMADSFYTQKIADEVLARMAEGESVRSICRSPGMPSEARSAAGRARIERASLPAIAWPANFNSIIGLTRSWS
jgi:hypothetical protein